MSSFPRYDLSSQYTSVSATMAEGLEEVMKKDYSIAPKRIPLGVLGEAQELFETAIQKPSSVKEMTTRLMVLDHLRAINPARYAQDKEEILLFRDVRNLASLLKDFEKLKTVPEYQREFVPMLQRFFGLLSNTGEDAIYAHHMSGEYNGKYSLEIGM